MTPTLPSPEQAWLAARTQLQREMLRSFFDTWVKEVWFVAYEDDVLTLGAASAETCEWLTARLTSTVARLLTGLLARPVSVSFIVQETGKEPEEEPAESTAVSNQPPEVLTLQAEYQSLYDQIVQPEQVIVLPGYFLRYLPWLGPELAWLYVGFRQAAYEAGASRNPSKPVGASAKRVCRFAGMSPRSFWRWIARPGTWQLLRGLVTSIEAPPAWTRGSDGRPHQVVRSYRVAMTLPLTPFDEQSLHVWLERRLAQGDSPAAAVQAALDTRPEELLPWPERVPDLEANQNEPRSVREVVLDLCAGRCANELEQISELADALAQHLIPAKDLVILSLYFVTRWVPRLGPGAAWLVGMMRDRCFINRRTGEVRDEVRLAQGYAEAARLLGLKRVKTAWEWLRDPQVALFIRETGREEGGWETAARRFKVVLDEPLAEADSVHEAAGASDTHRENAELESAGASVTHSGAVVTHTTGASGTHNGAGDSHSGATVSHNGADGTAFGAPVTHRPGANGTLPWRKWHSLNSLTPDLNHPENSSTTPPGMVAVGSWDLSALLRHNRVSKRNQDLLLEKDASGTAFVSWLLYAAGAQGIRDPVAHAVSRLLQEPGRGAGGAWERLARLPPERLADLLERELRLQSPRQTDWRSVVDGASRERLRALADQLGISLPDMNEIGGSR